MSHIHTPEGRAAFVKRHIDHLQDWQKHALYEITEKFDSKNKEGHRYK